MKSATFFVNWTVLLLLLVFFVTCCLGQQCSRRPELVYQEKGDVIVTILLDLTQGIKCDQKSATSSQSMHGIMQTLTTLNAIQFINGVRIGIRVYDTCGQESMAMHAVLETALDLNLTFNYSCRNIAHLGFLLPVRSYPVVVQLTSTLNYPVTDISQWQASSPLASVVDLLGLLKWSSVAVISQSKQTLANFAKKASEGNICIVAQSLLPTITKTRETTARAVRRSKRSGSKVYVLIGSAEFLLNLVPFFNSNATSPMKFVLIANDNWSPNLTHEIGQSVQEALIIRPQRILSDDNISARVFYTMLKQFKSHINSACQGRLKQCQFEPQHQKKILLEDDDFNILKLSKDMDIYNEQFPVTHLISKGEDLSTMEIGNIYEDKFIPLDKVVIKEDADAVCAECLCTNVDTGSGFSLQLRNELLMLVSAGISGLEILIIIILLLVSLKTQCSTGDESTYIFPLLGSALLLLLVSGLYLLVPSSVLCLTRSISLSGAYTIFLAVLFSATSTSFVDHPSTRRSVNFFQTLFFMFILAVQTPVLTYETIFRDETLLLNKILTDYGPKIECILDDSLSLKLFVYPVILLSLQTLFSFCVLKHHWQMKPVQIKTAATSLLCTAANVSWAVCYFILEKQWRDLIILSGLQGNAFLVIFFIVIPQIVGDSQRSQTTFRNKDLPVNGHPPDRQQHIYAVPHEHDRRSNDS